MKKLNYLFIMLSSLFCFVPSGFAETSIPNYGFYENANEISAKNDAINNIHPSNIFDYNTSPNQNGETIVDGKYYIAVSYNGGNNGTDTDYVYLSDLKGAKGDTGATGATGAQGVQGLTGAVGPQGLNGVNGINGEKGDKGDKGDTGANGQDVDPETVNNINTNITNTNNSVAQTNNRVDDLNNRIGRLEKPQGIVGLVLRVQDSRKWQTNLFIDYSVTRSNISMYGVRFTYKVGKSYEETRLDELERKLNRVLGENDRLEREATAEPYITANGVGIRDTHKF